MQVDSVLWDRDSGTLCAGADVGTLLEVHFREVHPSQEQELHLSTKISREGFIRSSEAAPIIWNVIGMYILLGNRSYISPLVSREGFLVRPEHWSIIWNVHQGTVPNSDTQVCNLYSTQSSKLKSTG